MLISVVTPVRNGAKTIARTLASISVQQAKFEHIVVDGGSTDETVDIVESYRSVYPVTLVRKADRSMYEGVWNGMQVARGDVLCYLNADDVYLPWTLATVSSVLDTSRGIDWITGIPSWMRLETGIGSTMSYAPVYPRKWIRRGWYTDAHLGFLQQESMFWSRRLWERANPGDIFSQYRLAADFHLWKRFSTIAELNTVACALGCFVVSDQQASRIRRDTYLDECGIPKNLQRPRRWTSIVNRLVSNVLAKRVLLPHVN